MSIASDPIVALPSRSLQGLHLARPAGGWVAEPLVPITVVAPPGGTVAVEDAAGHEYFRTPPGTGGDTIFLPGGALGTHTVRLLDDGGEEAERLTFDLDARTCVDDTASVGVSGGGGRFHGRFRGVFDACVRSLRVYEHSMAQSREWRGRTFHHFVEWILDHCYAARGAQYFSPHTGSFVEMFAQTQREDGMVWSNAFTRDRSEFFLTAYAPLGYSREIDGLVFNRQPVENHCESNFVDALHMHWKASGDDDWLRRHIDHAVRALDYTAASPVRWSERFGLLKRGCTIDSWDLQVQDEYTVEFPLGSHMMIDPDRTKFVIFYGDNTAYAQVAEDLAEMLGHLGRADDAARFRERAKGIRDRLDAAAWNGEFFTHHVEEDPTVKRNLGVDEGTQFSFSNAYSLNRGIKHGQAVPIIEKYRRILSDLPEGSVGEWYSILPPFGRGFEDHNAKWHYMNGGVHGHAAGELSRGAFEHGYESYGADILLRVAELSKQSKGLIRFAYRGGFDRPAQPQRFTAVDLSARANMDSRGVGDAAGGVPAWMGGEPGNDMPVPVGEQTFAGVPYQVTDPAKQGRRGVVAVGGEAGGADRVTIPLDGKAGAVYLLHTVNHLGPSKVAAAMTLEYDDGSTHTLYLSGGRHVAGWWYPRLDGSDAGVAWRGPNGKSTEVGLSWVAIANPHPERTLRGVTFDASREGATYALVGLTLADRMPWSEPPIDPHSSGSDGADTGGPDNWAGGLCLAALVEGLAGIRNAAGVTAFERVRIAPRWVAAEGVGDVSVTVRYAASKGYVAYRWRHDPAGRAIELTFTGSGSHAELRILLPAGVERIVGVTVDESDAATTLETVRESRYAVLSADLSRPRVVRVRYR